MWFSAWGRSVRVLAVSHTGGILATLATVWGGGIHVIMAGFDPDLAVDLIEREAVTRTLLVPTMLAAAVGAQLARPRNVSSLRYLSHGASPISAETLRRTRQAFPGAGLLHVYGTTETTPITTLLPHEERILDTPREARLWICITASVRRWGLTTSGCVSRSLRSRRAIWSGRVSLSMPRSSR